MGACCTGEAAQARNDETPSTRRRAAPIIADHRGCALLQRKGISMKSILGMLTGAVLSAVVSVIAIVLILLGSIALTGTHGVPLADALASSPSLYPAGYVGMMLGSLLGGYVAAAIARNQALLVGALSSFLWVLDGIHNLLNGEFSENMTWTLFILSAAPVLGVLGGYLRKSR
jgi:hypothetical protein